MEFAADSKEVTGGLLYARTEFQPNLEAILAKIFTALHSAVSFGP
jgi:hypothetical protein